MSEWEEIGSVGVDSGTIMFIDPCKVLNDEEYDKLTKQVIYNYKNGYVGSGWGGDGNFPVYVKKNGDGLVMELKVIFNE